MVFAAETGDAEANGRAKLARKRADLIVVNEVGPDKAFGAETNAATVIGADGSVHRLPRAAQGGRWPTPCGTSWSRRLAGPVLTVGRFRYACGRPCEQR